MVNSSGPRLIGWKHAWAWARLLALTTLLTATYSTSAWQRMKPTAVADRIARDRQFIDASETQKLTPAQVGRLWSEIASDEQDLGDFGQAEEAYNHALRLLEREPKLQKDYAITLNNLGTLLAASGRGEASLNCRRRALDIQQKLGDPLEIARAQAHLADAYLMMGQNKQARHQAEIANRALEALPQATQKDRASALLGYSFASCMTHHCAEGLSAALRAMGLASRAEPADSFALGQIGVGLGLAQWQTGDRTGAEASLKEAIRILRIHLSPGNPYLLQALEIYRQCLDDDHKQMEALQIAEEERGMQTSSTNGCSSCTISVYGLRNH